jgi:HlyD family secretion protein
VKRFVLIATCVSLVVAGAACGPPDGKAKAEEKPPKPVRAGQVDTGTVERYLTAAGSVVPVRDAWVSAEVGGQVVEKHVTEGDRVFVDADVPADEQTTNRIASIDPADYQRRLAQAEASLKVAEAGLTQSKATQKSLAKEIALNRPLYEDEVISVKAWDDLVTRKEETDAQVALYEARVDEAKQAVAIAESNLAKATVRSPLDDVLVAEVAFDKGEFVTVGQRLARVVDLDTMWVDVEIGESRIGDIFLGRDAAFSVPAYPGDEFTGTVKTISPAGDRASRSFLVRLAVDNADHRLKAGMFAVVRIPINKRHDVTVIPKSAVKQEGKFRYVFLVEPEKTALYRIELATGSDKLFRLVQERRGWAVKRRVELGFETGDSIEVLEGLEPGQQIVTAGVENLADGDTVTLLDAGAPPSDLSLVDE